jgi:hypothetical protein
LLDTVPDVVGNGVPGQPGPDGSLPSPVEGESGSPDLVSSMLANVTFKEEHVKRILSSIFDFVATKLDDDGLKLTGWKLEMVGEPTAQMANAMWAAFMAKMPDLVSKWCETTPGASAFMAAWGSVGTIMIISHMQVVSERKNKHTTADPARPATTKQAARPGPTAIHSEGGIQWAENMHG